MKLGWRGDPLYGLTSTFSSYGNTESRRGVLVGVLAITGGRRSNLVPSGLLGFVSRGPL